jgi:hypothetical protein
MSMTMSSPFTADSSAQKYSAPPADSITSAGAATTAVQRVALSRERLRQAMQTTSAPSGASAPGGSTTASANLFDALKSIPGAGIFLDAVNTWWAQHPLHTAGLVATGAAKAIVQPMAQKNPFGLMIAMVLLGAMVAWKKPWRWLLTPALFAGLLPQLVSKFVTHMPLEAWLAAFESRNQPQSQTQDQRRRTTEEERTNRARSEKPSS